MTMRSARRSPNGRWPTDETWAGRAAPAIQAGPAGPEPAAVGPHRAGAAGSPAAGSGVPAPALGGRRNAGGRHRAARHLAVRPARPGLVLSADPGAGGDLAARRP